MRLYFAPVSTGQWQLHRATRALGEAAHSHDVFKEGGASTEDFRAPGLHRAEEAGLKGCLQGCLLGCLQGRVENQSSKDGVGFKPLSCSMPAMALS